MQASSYRPQRTAEAKQAPQAQTQQTSAGKVTVRYKVAKGDTLYSICQAADVDLALVKSWNKITSTISIGQELVLYLTSSQASKFQTWAKKNKLASAGPDLKRVYQVKPGDSVYQIAARYQVSPQDVMAWNNLTPASKLQPGENLVLILPEKK
jgi:membrane-bound lytic murein transglycosylase D